MKTKVDFDTTAYQATYGHTPRGRGSWAFAFDRQRDVYFFVPGSMLYSDAKKAAVALVRSGRVDCFDARTRSTSTCNPRGYVTLYACT